MTIIEQISKIEKDISSITKDVKDMAQTIKIMSEFITNIDKKITEQHNSMLGAITVSTSMILTSDIKHKMDDFNLLKSQDSREDKYKDSREDKYKDSRDDKYKDSREDKYKDLREDKYKDSRDDRHDDTRQDTSRDNSVKNIRAVFETSKSDQKQVEETPKETTIRKITPISVPRQNSSGRVRTRTRTKK